MKPQPTKKKFKTPLKLQILLNTTSILLISYLIAVDAVHTLSAIMGFVLAVAIKLASDNVDDLCQ
jgi:hypothetical protein